MTATAEIKGVTPGLVSQIGPGEVSTIEALDDYIAAPGGMLELTADVGAHLPKLPGNTPA